MPSFDVRPAGRLRRAVVASLLPFALVAAPGCGDDDGVSPLRPDRDIAGMWIRYQPIPKGAIPVALPRTINDTLFLGNHGTGQWSREVPMSAGIEPLRMTTSVELRSLGPRLVLFSGSVPCPACDILTMDQARLSTMLPVEPYRIYRTDVDHLTVVPAAPAPGTGTAYYHRQPFEVRWSRS